MARGKSREKSRRADRGGTGQRRGRSPARGASRGRGGSGQRRGRSKSQRGKSRTPPRRVTAKSVTMKRTVAKAPTPPRRARSPSSRGRGRGRGKSKSPSGRGRGRGGGRGKDKSVASKRVPALADDEVATPSGDEEPWEKGAGRMMRPDWIVNNHYANANDLLPQFRRLTLGGLIEIAVYDRSPGLTCDIDTSVVGTVCGIIARVSPPTDAGIELVLRSCVGSNTLMNSFLAAEVGPSGDFFRVHLCREGEEECSTLPGNWVNDAAHKDWRVVLGEGMLHSHCWRLRVEREIDEPWLDGCFTAVTVDTDGPPETAQIRYMRTRYPQKTVREETVSGVLARERRRVAAASASSDVPDMEILGVTRGGKPGEPRFIPAPVLPGARTGAARSGIVGKVDKVAAALAAGTSGTADRSKAAAPPLAKTRVWRPSSFLAPKLKAAAIRGADPKLLMPSGLESLPPAPVPGATGTAGASDMEPRISSGARSAEIAKLAEFAKAKAAKEKESRGNPSKVLAMRASAGASGSSSSSGNQISEDVLAQVCAALGVDPSGKPLVKAEPVDGFGGPETEKPKKKKKRRKKRRSRRRRRDSSSRHSSSSSSSYYSHSASPFRFASRTGVGHENAIRETSRRKPGALLTHGLQKMEKLVNPAVGGPGGEKVPVLPPSAQKYLTCLVHVAQKMNLGRRDRQELQTLAQCLDHLASGRLAPLGDILMQRFKAVETAVSTKSWDIAPHMELVEPLDGTGVTSAKEHELAAKMTLKDGQLRTMLDRGRHHRQSGHQGHRDE